jgi:hypothetical protein
VVRKPSERVVRSDRGWFLIFLLVFMLSIGGLFGAHAIYRATGPHPRVTMFMRRVKGYANRLVRLGRLKQAQR